MFVCFLMCWFNVSRDGWYIYVKEGRLVAQGASRLEVYSIGRKISKSLYQIKHTKCIKNRIILLGKDIRKFSQEVFFLEILGSIRYPVCPPRTSSTATEAEAISRWWLWRWGGGRLQHRKWWCCLFDTIFLEGPFSSPTEDEENEVKQHPRLSCVIFPFYHDKYDMYSVMRQVYYEGPFIVSL